MQGLFSESITDKVHNDVALSEIIDAPAIQSLMEDFYRLTKIGCSLVDLQGNILVAVGWQDICTKFHRIHPETLKRCIESDTELCRVSPYGQCKAYRCKNNLWDASSPIVINDMVLGYIFLGQFFYEDEEVDLEFFRKQARQYNFDEQEYLAALERVPRYRRETVDSAMSFYSTLAAIISSQAYKNVQIMRVLHYQDQLVEELKIQKHFHETIIEATQDIFVVQNTDFTILHINQAGCKLLDKSKKEIIGKKCFELLGKNQQCEECGSTEALSTNKSVCKEKHFPEFNKFFECRSIPVLGGDGNIVYLVEQLRDITDMKRYIEALRESELRNSSILNAIHDLIFILDQEGKFIDYHAKDLNLLAVQPSDFLGKSIRDVLPADLAEQFMKTFEEVQQSKQVKYIEYSLDMPSGTKEFEAYVAPIDNTRLLTINRDITERKRVEEELLRSRAELQAIYDNSPTMVCVVDSTRQVLYANPAFTNFTQSSPEKLKNGNACGVFGCINALDDPRGCGYGNNCDQCPLLQAIQDTFRTGAVHQNIEFNSFVIRNNVREEITLLAATALIEDNQHKNLLLCLQDVSERKRSEEQNRILLEQLSQSRKLESIGRLAGGVAHDYNNMLTAILGYGELAKKSSNPNEPIYQYVDHILKAAYRSVEITNQLLAFARKQTIQPRTIDINHTIDDLMKMLEKLIGENIKLYWFPGNSLWYVYCDSAQITQILVNLVVNARDAISDVGYINIETSNVVIDEEACSRRPYMIPGEYVVISVSDNGCGMDEETLEKLFEPFFTTKAVGKGTQGNRMKTPIP